MILRVTAEDIQQGERSCCMTCPIALALCRVFGVGAYVTPRTGAHVADRKFALSRGAIRFIKAFDEHGRGAVKPASFRLVEVQP